METFIVRLWAPAPDLAEEISPGELHGSVEHVASKDTRRFQNGDDLLVILTSHATDSKRRSSHGNTETASS